MKSKAEILTEKMTTQILDGEYLRQDAIPSERQLAGKYNVSRMIIRKVLAALSEKKIIYRKTPRKYFITKNVRDSFVDFKTKKPNTRLNVAFVMHPRWSHHTVFYEFYKYFMESLPADINVQAYFNHFLQEDVYRKNNVDIIITDHGFRDEELHIVEAQGIRTIVTFRERDKGNYIVSDDVAGGYLTGKFLAENGHKKIVCFYWGPEKSECNIQTAGFLKAAGIFDLTPVPITIDSQSEIKSPREGVEYLLKRNIDFSCVLAPDDEHAFNIISVIQQEGYKVPDNISVFGYGDICFARESVIPLTTIRKPLPLMASCLHQALEKFLASGTLEIRKKIVPELIVRGSVKRLE